MQSIDQDKFKWLLITQLFSLKLLILIKKIAIWKYIFLVLLPLFLTWLTSWLLTLPLLWSYTVLMLLRIYQIFHHVKSLTSDLATLVQLCRHGPSRATLPQNITWCFHYSSFGKLSVAPSQKWNALFRQCFQSLGVTESILTPTGSHFANGPSGQAIDNAKIWQNVAVAISCSHKERTKVVMKVQRHSELEKSVDCLEVIPQFGQKTLTFESYMELKQYLQNVSLTSDVLIKLIS